MLVFGQKSIGLSKNTNTGLNKKTKLDLEVGPSEIPCHTSLFSGPDSFITQISSFRSSALHPPAFMCYNFHVISILIPISIILTCKKCNKIYSDIFTY